MEQLEQVPSKERRKEIQAIILGWWDRLKDNRGARAQLRHCREPGEVLLHAVYYELNETLQPVWPRGQTMALAAIAGLLSHVDTQESKLSFPEQLGNPKAEGGKPPLSESRLRQLIKSHDWSEYYSRMRRAILMLKRKANPVSLIDLTRQFGFELNQGTTEQGKSFQFKMANDYFKSSFKTGKTKE